MLPASKAPCRPEQQKELQKEEKHSTKGRARQPRQRKNKHSNGHTEPPQGDGGKVLCVAKPENEKEIEALAKKLQQFLGEAVCQDMARLWTEKDTTTDQTSEKDLLTCP